MATAAALESIRELRELLQFSYNAVVAKVRSCWLASSATTTCSVRLTDPTLLYVRMTRQLSVREIVALSYEAGGVFPTLLGYAIGAIGTFGFCVFSQSIALRLASMLLALLFYVQCLRGTDDVANVLLLTVAALTGVGCTFIQVLSWKQAFAHLDARRQARAIAKQRKKNKVVKED